MLAHETLVSRKENFQRDLKEAGFTIWPRTHGTFAQPAPRRMPCRPHGPRIGSQSASNYCTTHISSGHSDGIRISPNSAYGTQGALQRPSRATFVAP
jgi:hypothetical protein